MNANKSAECPICNKSTLLLIDEYKGGETLLCNLLYQCRFCELVFAYPMPDEKALDKYYRKNLYYDQVVDPFQTHFYEFSYRLNMTRLALIQEQVDFIQDAPKLIDIGAGNANFGQALKQLNVGVSYDVVEPSNEVRRQYGDWVNNKYQDLSVVKDTDYDLAIMNQVLEHVPNPVSFLRSIIKILKKKGFLYIDVPFRDYYFKPSVEPHLLFWNRKSLQFCLHKVGLRILFCDTAGMPHERAKRFFNQQSLQEKILDPWKYAHKINQVMKKVGLPSLFDTFKQFKADEYGGDRQWLRCIAQKTERTLP